MASAEGTDSIELESVFSSKNRDFHSSTLKSTSGTTDDGEFYPKKKTGTKQTAPTIFFSRRMNGFFCFPSFENIFSHIPKWK